MKIKKGDKVMVVAGKDRGKVSTVLRAIPKEDKVVVDGVHVLKRHQRATRGGRKGQIVERPMPIHVSNVQVLDPKSGKPTRIKIERTDGLRVRIARKSGARIA